VLSSCGHDVIVDRLNERCGDPHRFADPIRHHRAVEIDPSAGINTGLLARSDQHAP
jgi:hypothetical protein